MVISPSYVCFLIVGISFTHISRRLFDEGSLHVVMAVQKVVLKLFFVLKVFQLHDG